MANIDVDEGKNHQDEQLQGWADSPGSEYPGNLGEDEDQESLQFWNVDNDHYQPVWAYSSPVSGECLGSR